MPGLLAITAATLTMMLGTDAPERRGTPPVVHYASERKNLPPTPDGYYASGWPIALAEAACDDDEGCLTLLANCGPNSTDCMAGVSMCTYSRAGEQVFAQACRTDVIASGMGKAILVDVPGGPTYTLFLPQDGTAALNGQIGTRTSDHCVETWQDQARFCATPLVTQQDFELWINEAAQ